MLGRNEAVSADRALDILLNLPLNNKPSLEVPVEEAYGRVLSCDITSPENMPVFSRSAMDGFAVRASDTFGCSESVPAYLRLNGYVKMGEAPDVTAGPGDAVSIPTGGMLPEGADAVVMLENVQQTGDDMIEVMRPVAPGENVIAAGEDIRERDYVLRRGIVLRPQDIAALAGLGITRVKIYKKPLVSIISTGDEIVPPQSHPGFGQVRDINSFNLAGLVMNTGGIPEKFGIFPDEYNVLRDAICRAVESTDVVLISGGSSVGTRDMTAALIESMQKGGTLFHGVAVKPGKPLIGGFVRGVPVFGLPGHPAAVTVSFHNFVEPVIKKIGGVDLQIERNRPAAVSARLVKNISSAPGREDYIRVSLYEEGGELCAEPVFGKSGLISTLVRADGMVMIPSHAQGIPRGEMVKVRIF
ncbi:MAG TPA: molybdopterin molybdenumtransferase MoeA [Nitrospirae bacterium]|nr:molybdopterin molybdenumtransferase MoeA [Nitrospirota bacterium]HDZ88869.1 molybdopterin molybdenumtransferase MoeA [Nitrospirota bacterium]